jgi:hypothetical protein
MDPAGDRAIINRADRQDLPEGRVNGAEAPARTARRAILRPWHCDGTLRDGRVCGRVLMELDWDRPSFIVKACERCGHRNTFVEAYRAT